MLVSVLVVFVLVLVLVMIVLLLVLLPVGVGWWLVISNYTQSVPCKTLVNPTSMELPLVGRAYWGWPGMGDGSRG